MDTGAGPRERELAMEALDAHRREGRLERTEHASRCAVASRASTRRELDALFRDLPEPHPVYPQAATSASPSTRTAPSEPSPPSAPEAPDLPELVAPTGAAIARHAGLISLMTPAVAALLFALSGFRIPWIFILVPIVLAGVAYVAHRHSG